MRSAADEGSVGRLADRVFWESKWSARPNAKGVGFDPAQTQFRDLHALFQRLLPVDPSLRFLEVGCFPGNYMWYFNRYFQYRVHGIEYVDSCCERAREYLRQASIDAEVWHKDLFSFELPEEERFDVVASFGFVEHFSNYSEAIRRHAELVGPGGYLVIMVPNHQGLYGKILQKTDPVGFATHNQMSLSDLTGALSMLPGLTTVEAGYNGHIGFWNCGLYRKASALGRLPYKAIRAPLWGIEKMGRLIPDSAAFSPNIVAIARKAG